MPKPGELTFVAPRGAQKPPRHLADLSPAERKEAVAAIGEKPFRAKQLSQHYFARYAHDPEQWTDIPAGSPEPDGLGLSQRGITVSTVGLVPAIHRFADEGFKCRLAISLHAPDDELRDTLVPVNTRWKVREVLDAGFEYTVKSGRRLSIEYALIRDINDQAWRGDRLGRLLKGRPVHVNLIPLNPTPGSKWTASRPEDERAFVEAIAAHGVPVTVRDTRGQEIDGACGQLAAGER
jgi:23S rRNA (adenine2503-C2)-methyltransferase